MSHISWRMRSATPKSRVNHLGSPQSPPIFTSVDRCLINSPSASRRSPLNHDLGALVGRSLLGHLPHLVLRQISLAGNSSFLFGAPAKLKSTVHAHRARESFSV